jgi:hypothetical protein
MAVTQTPSSAEADERTTVKPFAEQMLEFVRRSDPEATYTLAPPIDPGIWIVNLYVRGDLVDDPVLTDALADRMTDILIEHGVGIAPLLRDRHKVAGTGMTE